MAVSAELDRSDHEAVGVGGAPRFPLAVLPTPLVRARRLERALGCPPLYVKRDDLTGFALGGNKVRKLEFVLEEHRLAGVTCLITAGGPQSNHCRVTAAFAARAGLRCVIVTQGPDPERPTGNALLQRLFGAEIVTVANRADRTPAMVDVAARVEREGGRALVVPIGASTGLGCLGYAGAAVELVAQLDRLPGGTMTTRVVVPTSSCGTLAGLALGLTLLGRGDVALLAMSADASEREIGEATLRIAREGAALLSTDRAVEADRFQAFDDGVGEGYGIATPASTAALERFARLEGLVLDPTYTAKAAAGMIDWIRAKRPTRNERVVFLHTGGHPGLLA
jgi:1-aminocyclopropane-1-carboxylate deaminase/D-cysteine desulfhydrase-like pyridoxal-dependent ACC family enzyme